MRPGQCSVLFLFGSMSLGLPCPVLSLSGSLRSDQHSALFHSGSLRQDRATHYLSLGQAGPVCPQNSVLFLSLGQVGPLVSTARSALSRFEAGPQCPQHSVMFLSGSGRTTMSTARSALTLSGSLRPDRCTELHIAQWTDLFCSTAGV